MPAPDPPTHSVSDANPHSTDAAGRLPQTAATERYALGDEIARGGMGIIFRATDTVLGREVAVKVLQDKYGPDSWGALRFADEARITGQLQHPSIPPVHDLGMLPDGRPFLAMKLIKGQTLADLLKARPDPSAERGRFVAVFEQICQALAYAHSLDVIHRDLKPANVMVGAFGEVQVMDWGLAKVLGAEPARAASPIDAANEMTRAWTQISPTPETGSHTLAGSLLGTPAFAPPEQVAGEIDKVDIRADVFGLGAILAVILTGKPPYVGENFETVRLMAIRGKLDECFARLDTCGVEPELVALCKSCLAFEPAYRPASAGEVASAVAELRTAADERARRAELERVRVEGEQATAEARAAERRKRRRLWIGAAAVLGVAVVGGLTAVVAVQRRANAELADEQAKVEARNQQLADEQVKVQARFEMAVKAIETFHTGVSEEALLKNDQLKELRTKLLKQAAGFYAGLEKLLAGQTDAKSRKMLAAGYFQLAELTEKIGDKKEALRVHRQALAVRRELAAAPGADVETRLDVARSLLYVGGLLNALGDTPGALAGLDEGRDLAERLLAEEPSDAVRSVLALNHSRRGSLLAQAGDPAKALQSHGKALDIRQKLADANPAVNSFQSDLAWSHMNIGGIMMDTGKPAEALKEFQKALAIRQKLADDNRAVTSFQSDLAASHNAIGLLLSQDGKPAQALQAYEEALAIRQKLADANPAVHSFQSDLALILYNHGVLLRELGKPGEVLKSYEKALAIREKLVDANPAVTFFQQGLAQSHFSLGTLLSEMRKPEEALLSYEKARAIMQKLADANPAVAMFRRHLASTHNNIGWLHAHQKRYAEALLALDQGLAICQKLTNDHPANAYFAHGLGYSHAYRGWVKAHAGQPAEAAADLRRAVELWAQNKALDIETRFERSRALALLAGLGPDAKSGVTAAEALAFADQSVAALADVVKLGWANPGELKEPDFDSLRGRPDFQKLFAEVEKKAPAGPEKGP
jgi:eukaryotic-like serine/threonine-protein kinase